MEPAMEPEVQRQASLVGREEGGVMVYNYGVS
jgi:hypothetical protein